MNLRCYCCGEPLGERFVLSRMGDPKEVFDRVFLMREECGKRMYADTQRVTVRLVVRPPPVRL